MNLAALLLALWPMALAQGTAFGGFVVPGQMAAIELHEQLVGHTSFDSLGLYDDSTGRAPSGTPESHCCEASSVSSFLTAIPTALTVFIADQSRESMITSDARSHGSLAPAPLLPPPQA